MRALRQLARSASASLLLTHEDGQAPRSSHGAAMTEDDDVLQNDGETIEQTPLDKTLTKIGFGIYQKKLLFVA
jgi:hypothetical protein